MTVIREEATFWVVWTKKGRNPRHSHRTQESAEKEAARLALKFPGTKFIVLGCVGKFIASVPDAGGVIQTRAA